MCRRSPRSAAAAAASLLLLLLLCIPSSAAAKPQRELAPKPQRELAPGVCPSIDIRTSFDNLNKLRGCRVIEGTLSIVLIEKARDNIMTFPELTEVTGYIIVYRVKGIRSLGDLFPNLSVVRGFQLFRDFAIVIFDNENLEHVGLKSLTMIERGAVRIQNNDKLCFTDTIDWSRIMPEGTENNVIAANYDSRLCGLCPNAQTRLSDGTEKGQCPTDNNHKLLCWDDRNCQKICPSKCEDRPCTKDFECCHPSCTGGCNGTGPDDCFACKNFSFQPSEKAPRKCLDQCPPGTYELFKRCVSEQECRAMLPIDSRLAAAANIRAYKTFGKSCLYVCPSGHMESGDVKNATCIPCPETGCVKECVGDKIDSIGAADKFHGCTHIRGTLHIALRATKSNTVAKLEASLGEIREIHGCLKVARSNPLVSLMFLKKLRVIAVSNEVESCRGQALHIFNNQNLELLWDWKNHHSLKIISGGLYIHFNPKLCFDEIKPLKYMGVGGFTFREVDVSDNGDEATCFQEKLQLRLDTSADTAVILSWNMFCLDDFRKLLGYSIYYIETEQNVTLYGQRDACSDTWNVVDITIEEVNNKTRMSYENKSHVFMCSHQQPVFHPLTQLSPYTRYAAYVKAFTTSQDKKGAQSDILYFRTLPIQPSPPLNPTVEVHSPNSATIKWSPPLFPNGTITTYQVQVQRKLFNIQYIKNSNRQYCSNPNLLSINMPYSLKKEEDDEEVKGMKELTNEVKQQGGTCDCEKKPREKKFTQQIDEETQENILFENSLQNMVYVKSNKTTNVTKFNKLNIIRIKRNAEHEDGHKFLVETNDVKLMPSPLDPQANCTNSTDEGYLETQCYSVEGHTTRLLVENMRHYTWYVVNIWACRDRVDNETLVNYEENGCSKEVNIRFRTLELVNGDAVSNLHASMIKSNKTSPEVNMTWIPPPNPNGFVLGYNVYYSRIEEHKEVASFQHCLDAEQHCGTGNISELNSCNYVMARLLAGNYSLRVTPITAKGAGNTSEVFVFIPERQMAAGREWVWGVVGGCVVAGAALAAGLCYLRRGLRAQHDAHKLFASVNPEYVSSVYVPDEWEVPRTSVSFLRELGQGSFGMVYEGIAKNIEKGIPETKCAVKTVNEHATDRERVEFLNEASVMKAFDTFHVVRLLGVVSHGQPTLVIMELMELGDLKTYLRSHRPDADSSIPKKDNNSSPPSLQNILQMAIEIADGMAYLSAKKFVHRDLAARNCMVAGDLTVKVGDFGMTRDIYETDYYRKGTKGLLPVRWMSPESLKDGVFSSNSDIWSYGVVLWEMATLAMQPYQGLSNEQVVRYVVEGGVMERPEHCPDRLYELMRECWSHRASSRPSFLQLVGRLSGSAPPYFRQRSFFNSPQGQEMFAALNYNTTAAEESSSGCGVEVGGGGGGAGGAQGSGSAGNLFGVSGRLASWVRELSSLRARDLHTDLDHAHHMLLKGPNGVVGVGEEPTSTGC